MFAKLHQAVQTRLSPLRDKGLISSQSKKVPLTQEPSLELSNELSKCTMDNCEVFTFGGETIGKVVHIIDGDTQVIAVKVFGLDEPKLIHLRGWQSNCPETRSLDLIEKHHGLTCKEISRRILLDKIVFIKFHGIDNFGRALGEIFLPGIFPNASISYDPTQHTISDLTSYYDWMKLHTTTIVYNKVKHWNFDACQDPDYLAIMGTIPKPIARKKKDKQDKE
jgi:endonuclease YncB( thermonuclease family)